MTNISQNRDLGSDPRLADIEKFAELMGWKLTFELPTAWHPNQRAAAVARSLRGASDLVWFAYGGTETVDVLDLLDWGLIAEAKKPMIGTSDLTHLAWGAAARELPFLYGFDLANVAAYFGSEAERRAIGRRVEAAVRSHREIQTELMASCEVGGSEIIGGHSFTSTYMRRSLGVSLAGKCLFLEHHHDGETMLDAMYWFRQLLADCRLLGDWPASILLGTHEVVDARPEELSDAIMQLLARDAFSGPIGTIDHYRHIVPLGSRFPTG